jgi:rubrerythrin
MDKTDVVATLSKLQRMDQDAVQVYQDAIARTADEGIKSQLRTFQQDHRHHIAEIDELINQQNWQPLEPTPEFESLMMAFKQQVDMADGGDDAVMFAMDLGEKATNAEYAEALQLDIDQQVRDVIERNRGDERRHLAFIEEHIPRGLRSGGGSATGAAGGGASARTSTTRGGGIPGAATGDAGPYGGMGGDVPPGGGGSGPATEFDSREVTPGGDVTADYGMGGRAAGQDTPRRRRPEPGTEVRPQEEQPKMRGQVEGDSGSSGSGVAGSGSGE